MDIRSTNTTSAAHCPHIEITTDVVGLIEHNIESCL